MKILYAGTPEISVPLLEVLYKNFEVCAVLTAVDKASGRSSALKASPVKETALRLGIPVLQFENLKTEARNAVSETGADTLICFAFGKIFGPKFLSLFKRKYNIHPSELPLLRGPSPIQFEILNCFSKGGISVQNITDGIDEGELWACKTFPLDGTETSESLGKKVSVLAAQFVPAVLNDICTGKIQCKSQSGQATFSSVITHDMSRLDFNQPAKKVHALIRAMYPWPKAWALINGYKVFITSVYGNLDSTEPLTENCIPGQILGMDKKRGLCVACSDALLYLASFQLPTKKSLPFMDFVNGNRWILNGVFNV